MITITAEEFQTFTRYIYELTGITLDRSKTYLLESRLDGLLKEYQCRSYNEFYQLARDDYTRMIELKIIDQITTHETSFYRDSSVYRLLGNKIIPELLRRRTPTDHLPSAPIPLNIWCAACSTGQEIYSLAIILKEYLGDRKKYNLKLLGTDISDASIAQASYGHYSKFEIERGLPPNLRLKYFEKKDDSWKIRDEIRAMVLFQKQNLMRTFRDLTKFDIILCRNVIIYFGLADRELILKRLANRLMADGYLLLGSSEALGSNNVTFTPKQHGDAIYYQLKR